MSILFRVVLNSDQGGGGPYLGPGGGGGGLVAWPWRLYPIFCIIARFLRKGILYKFVCTGSIGLCRPYRCFMLLGLQTVRACKSFSYK